MGEKIEQREIFNYELSDRFDIEDVEGRRLYIDGEIDREVIDNIGYHILRFNRLDKGLPKEDRKPILLYISTNGGSVSEGYGLIDIISSSITPVYTINQAMCASMGFLIFIAGHKRYSMEHSEFLMHDGETFCIDSTAKMKDRMEFEMNQMETATKRYIISHTKITSEMYDEKYRVEWYFLPPEGKEIGVVDYIVGEDCTIDEIC